MTGKTSPTSPDPTSVRQPENYKSRLGQWVAILYAVVTRGLIVGLIVALLWHVAKDFSTDRVILEPVNVPGDYAKKGLSGRVIARRILDKIQRIRLYATGRGAVVGIGVSSPSQGPDIQVPGVGVSFRGLTLYLRQLFNVSTPIVSGDLTTEGDRLRATFRVGGKPGKVLRGSGDKLDKLLEEAAEYLLSHLDPIALAIYYSDKGETERLPALIESIRTASHSAEARSYACFLEGLIALEEGDYRATLERYEKAADWDPNNWLIYNSRGGIFEDQGRLREAEAEYRRAIALNSDASWPYANLGVVLLYLDRTEEAERVFGRAIAAAPNDEYGWYSRGWAWLEADDELAVRYFRHALEVRPDADYVYVHLATALRRLGQIEEAQAMHEEARRRLWVEADAFSSWGWQLLNEGKHQEAIKQFELALKAYPNRPTAVRGIAKAAIEQGQLGRAAEIYRSALSAQPNNAGFLSDWGRLLLQQGNYSEAAENLQKALALEFKSAAVFDSLADALEKMGDHFRAREVLSNSVQKHPEDTFLRFRYGTVLAFLSEDRAAVQQFYKAAMSGLDSPDLYLEYGRALERLGNNAGARHIYQEGLVANPDNADLVSHYAGAQ